MSPERESYPHKAEFERFLLKWVSMTLLTHFTYTQDISYDYYENHAIGLLKLSISVFYSAKCVVIIGLQSYCYIDVARATESIAETNQTNSNISVYYTK